MKKIFSFIKTTLIGGLFLIVPLLILVWIIIKILEVFRKIVAPISDHIDLTIIGGPSLSRVLATLLLLVLCFLAGLFAKTKYAGRLKDWVEDNILSLIPGYTLLKGMTESAAGLDSKHLKEVVLINIEEVWQIGFLMERIDADLNTVFIPGAPNPMAGDVVIVKWDRLKLLDLEEIDAMKISRKLGLDAKKILEGKINGATFNEKE